MFCGLYIPRLDHVRGLTEWDVRQRWPICLRKRGPSAVELYRDRFPPRAIIIVTVRPADAVLAINRPVGRRVRLCNTCCSYCDQNWLHNGNWACGLIQLCEREYHSNCCLLDWNGVKLTAWHYNTVSYFQANASDAQKFQEPPVLIYVQRWPLCHVA